MYIESILLVKKEIKTVIFIGIKAKFIYQLQN